MKEGLLFALEPLPRAEVARYLSKLQNALPDSKWLQEQTLIALDGLDGGSPGLVMGILGQLQRQQIFKPARF